MISKTIGFFGVHNIFRQTPINHDDLPIPSGVLLALPEAPAAARLKRLAPPEAPAGERSFRPGFHRSPRRSPRLRHPWRRRASFLQFYGMKNGGFMGFYGDFLWDFMVYGIFNGGFGWDFSWWFNRIYIMGMLMASGWWYTYPPEKYEFVRLDHPPNSWGK